jgi:hypothetical protein
MHSTIDAHEPLIDSSAHDGETVRISIETNRLGTYAGRILMDER